MATTYTKTGDRSIRVVCTTGDENPPANPAKATNTVAFSTAVAGNTVAIRGRVFTAIAAGGTAADYEFAVGSGGSADATSATNFAAAVNKHSGPGDLDMTASANAGTVTLTANDHGSVPNAWTLAKVGDPITVGGATFSGGADIVGMSLDGVGAYSVQVEADSGQTLSGAGSVDFYLLDEASGWRPIFVSGISETIAVAAGAHRGQAFLGRTVPAGRGRLVAVPSGVTVSSGSVTIYLNAVAKDGRAA